MNKPNLIGEKIVLRPITKADAAEMFKSLSDEEGMRLTGTQDEFTFEQVEAFCERVSKADDRADYAITLKEDPTMKGKRVNLSDKFISGVILTVSAVSVL